MPFGTLDCSATHITACRKQSLDLGKRDRRHHPIGIDGHQDLTAARSGSGIACYREVRSTDLDDRSHPSKLRSCACAASQSRDNDDHFRLRCGSPERHELIARKLRARSACSSRADTTTENRAMSQ